MLSFTGELRAGSAATIEIEDTAGQKHHRKLQDVAVLDFEGRARTVVLSTDAPADGML